MQFEDYKEAENFLFDRSAAGMKLGMDTIRDLVSRLGNPERDLAAVHIAGTNGKGSTAALMAAVLRAAGFKTGLFTSPHLVSMRERIRIDGEKISEKAVLALLNGMYPHLQAAGASFFEILTAMALLHFRAEKTDIAVLETGLGGRLDATSVITPEAAIITNIGHDHTGILGDSLRSIAAEKAGIFKKNVPCVTGVEDPDLLAVLREKAAPLHVQVISSRDNLHIHSLRPAETSTRFSAQTARAVYPDLDISLTGRHQALNAGLVLLTVEQLRSRGRHISERAVREGFSSTVWPGRLQLISQKPKILVDSAHNHLGAKTLAEAVREIFPGRCCRLVFGVLRDKKYEEMLSLLTPLADEVYLTRPVSDRAVEPEELGRLSCFSGRSIHVDNDIGTIWQKVKADAGPEDLIIAAGSLYLSGEILRLEAMHNPALLP